MYFAWKQKKKRLASAAWITLRNNAFCMLDGEFMQITYMIGAHVICMNSPSSIEQALLRRGIQADNASRFSFCKYTEGKASNELMATGQLLPPPLSYLSEVIARILHSHCTKSTSCLKMFGVLWEIMCRNRYYRGSTLNTFSCTWSIMKLECSINYVLYFRYPLSIQLFSDVRYRHLILNEYFKCILYLVSWWDS